MTGTRNEGKIVRAHCSYRNRTKPTKGLRADLQVLESPVSVPGPERHLSQFAIPIGMLVTYTLCTGVGGGFEICKLAIFAETQRIQPVSAYLSALPVMLDVIS